MKKKYTLFSFKWMILGAFMIAAAFLPGVGLADEDVQPDASQSNQVLNLLSKKHNKASCKDYLRKKRQTNVCSTKQ
jgi:hypothetical protein